MFVFRFLENIPIQNTVAPFKIKDTVHILNIGGKSFDPISDFAGNWRYFKSTDDLEVGKLTDFHAVKPNFPTNTGTAHGWIFPVIFNKPNIMFQWINAECSKRIQVIFLNIFRRWFHNDLELMMLKQPVGVFAISAVSWTSRRFNIRSIPWFWSNGA